jgi:hypothetical protein
MRLAAVALGFSLSGLLAAAPALADSKTAAVAGQDLSEPPPANGVDPAPRHGIYAEAAFGIFTTVGGAAGLSNGQPFLAMAVGSTLGSNATLFVSLGIGSSSSSCYDAAPSGDCLAADSFEAAYLEVGGSYGGELVHRLKLSGKLVAGLTQLAPSPVRDSTANTVPDNLFGPHFGAGVTLDYDTHLDHFSVGLDLTGRYTFAARPDTGTFGLFSIAFMPRVRYVF